MGGGHDPYLFPLDLPTFRNHVLARAAEATASRVAMHSSLLSIWRFRDDELL
jgi:hypothetical protein